MYARKQKTFADNAAMLTIHIQISSIFLSEKVRKFTHKFEAKGLTRA